MSDFTRRYLIAIILLLVTGFITFGAYSTRSYSGALYTQDVPMVIGSWYGKDMPMGERTYEILETRDAFMREYIHSSKGRVFLTVVFARTNRKVSHPPEVCLAGGGWSRTGRDVQMLTLGGERTGMERQLKANRIILQRGTEKQVVLYIYKAGEKLTSNYYVQQINIVLNSMIRKNTSSALIRFSSHIQNDNVEEATERIRKFAAEVIPILEECLP
jgi:EpsI family protein